MFSGSATDHFVELNNFHKTLFFWLQRVSNMGVNDSKKGFSGNHSTQEMIHSGAKKHFYNIFLLFLGPEDTFAKL